MRPVARAKFNNRPSVQGLRMNVVEELEAEERVEEGAAALAPHAQLSGVLPQDMDHQFTQQAEVVRRPPVAHLAVVFSKGHVQHLVAAVFHAPMPAHQSREALDVSLKLHRK